MVCGWPLGDEKGQERGNGGLGFSTLISWWSSEVLGVVLKSSDEKSGGS